MCQFCGRGDPDGRRGSHRGRQDSAARAVVADLLESSRASAHFLHNPLQRAKRDIDVICGHVVFDYDVSRELAGALEVGVPISPIAMV